MCHKVILPGQSGKISIISFIWNNLLTSTKQVQSYLSYLNCNFCFQIKQEKFETRLKNHQSALKLSRILVFFPTQDAAEMTINIKPEELTE